VLYSISHQTIYRYNQPVWLQPHLLRLQPRWDSAQTLRAFSLHLDPAPEGQSQYADLDGNPVTRAWFNTRTEQFTIQTLSQVETHRTNPFNYLLESWALRLPCDYPSRLLAQLQPYLQPGAVALDPEALTLAQDLLSEVHFDTVAFLSLLTQHLYQQCEYLTREQGDPWPAGVTWRRRQGSCRDLAVLWIEACRAVGLAARFVSGYEEGVPDQDQWHLHAWAEVYLPGAGWRGYDPTHGLAVSDRHVALVASAYPSYTAPVLGQVTPVRPWSETGLAMVSRLETSLTLQGM
jgi:transglutaminase-like putative cysteine protease